MGFNPLEERGMALEKQLRSFREITPDPYDKRTVDPYTRCRIIVMNGIEVESAMFSHQFNRHTDVPEITQALALSRRVEQQQQKAVNWLIPADETTLEVTLGYEQVAIDLTAWLARHETDPYLKQVMDFGLLEDFDHLYRYANLYDLLQGKQAEEVVGRLTEVMPGRPTTQEHRHPYDDVRRHYEKHTADPQSKLNAMTLVAAEQQTMSFYMTIGNRYQEPLARKLYAEIGMIEEQHVTQYESLLDPGETWLEQLVLHEYMECWLYHSFAEQEVDPRVKGIWEQHLDMEVGQLQEAVRLLRKYDGLEPEAFLPAALPPTMLFEPNKEYVRMVLAEQLDLTSLDTEIVGDAHARYEAYQATVHGGEPAPSEQVIEDHRQQLGGEYRLQTEGEHPNERLRAANAT